MTESDIVIWPGGLIGFHKVQTGTVKDDDGKDAPVYGYVEGAILALRANGDEALFASSVEDSRTPAAWIKVTDFVINPVAIATEDDFFEDEPLPDGVEAQPEDRPPMEPRRPSGMKVARRGES